MQMALTMALFAGGGFWLDRRFGTAPLFTVAGSVLAIVALALHLVRVVRQLDRRRDRRNESA
jgi:F0F1-type ATP synthase assembly protein I